jgi:putative ATP-dependent endonuclease of the OLD family
MKIKSVRIQNFRSIKDQTIEFSDFTCFVGANGSGKSNVLHALNVFFGESDIPGLDTRGLQEEDFHGKNIKEPIAITITFSGLSQEAKQELAHYVRQGQLVVSIEAQFDPIKGKAAVKQFGCRMVIRDFASFFAAEKEGKKVAELKDIYIKIREQYSDLPTPGTKEAMLRELRSFEEKHRQSCEELPSGDDFYGVSRGINLLEKYIQWVYIPAVKDASSEQAEAKATALGKLLARTVRSKINFKDSIEAIRSDVKQKYVKLLEDSQEQLSEVSNALRDRLIEWAHQDATLRLKWYQDPERAVHVDEPFAQAILGEAGFEGELTRFGHGLQRSFLLAVLQELSGSNVEAGPSLLLACEEPELYQHPPQARHLFNVLMRLSEQNSQILITTHSPYFVSGEGFESVRMVRKPNGESSITWATHDEVSERIAGARGEPVIQTSGRLAKINQALQFGLSEMFFASKIIFVEGLEDTAYITSYLHLLNLWDEYRRLGCHLVPTDGKSELIQPLAVARCLRIPAFVVIDADGDKADKNGRKEKHRKDNITILNMCGIAPPNPFPSVTLWGDNIVMWPSDIGQIVAADIGKDPWDKFQSDSDMKYGNAGGLRKNMLHISSSLQAAWDAGSKSANLKSLCEKIIDFAKRNR